MRYRRLGILAGTLVLTGGLLAGCGTASTASTTAATTSTTTTTSSAATQSSGQTSSSGSKGSAVTAASVDTSDLFSNRDLEQTADTSSAKTITLTSGQDVTISEEGVYVITGSAENTTIIVDAPDDAKVQLVLSGVTVTNDDFPVIYVKSADKVFVTTVSGTQNALSVTGEFTADGTTNTDAVIFCKSDLTLNGEGTLTVSSAQGNGISGKDEITITGGTYVINSKKDAIEAQDAINIADGDFTITTDKDGLHSEDSDDPTTGSVYIGGGTFVIDAGDDGIQATTNLTIDGGTFTIDAVEGLEGTFVTVNGGTISITASDDGINAAQKGSSTDVEIVINGGDITIVMGSGDTDALDANGCLYINGGTLDITASSPFDYDTDGAINGGTVYVNGEQVTEIYNSMMGGGGMGQMPDGRGRQAPGSQNGGMQSQNTGAV
ncbi:MAG: carbohydrate-binding domain-containing protein [Lachnospiraceae bacterium]|nr:carbohydrate-binding domain-containing protein [Lachnospiraceae bacterium]MCI1331544.1 carbohydrate-binding domain-containing protein [Lachnospiraceae bacterium]MDD6223182.1 carbohydrate-binding domain-containing protein [Lachnospiraceae bacterium]